MAVFEYESNSDENDPNSDSNNLSQMVSVMANGRALRNTIPKCIADYHDLDDSDHLVIEPTENGFEAVIVDA